MRERRTGARGLGRSLCAAKPMIFVVVSVVALLPTTASHGAEAPASDSAFRVTVQPPGENVPPLELTGPLQIVLFLTILSLLPSLLLTMTSFTRIVIVLSFIRRAISVQQLPPNQVLVGLSLFLTMFIMGPVWDEISTQAVKPYLEEEISQPEALTRSLGSLRTFMLRHTRRVDLRLFLGVNKAPKPEGPESVSLRVLIPAFVISELKTAFQMGFLIFLPFLIVDMVVASVLTSMGMFMLPPVMISIPFKILLFVLVDGWNLIIRSLVVGFA